MISNKEFKKIYKQKKFRMGVFQIRNTVNAKVFIESSMNLDTIWNRHNFQLRNNLHTNKLLQNDWTTYGTENFVFEILGEIHEEENGTIDYRKEIKKLEILFLEEIQPFDDKGYHLKQG